MDVHPTKNGIFIGIDPYPYHDPGRPEAEGGLELSPGSWNDRSHQEVINVKHSSVWQVWIRKFPDNKLNKPFESLASSWPVYPTSAASATLRYDVRGSGGNVRPQFIEAFHQGGHQLQGHVLATAQVGGDLIALCDCVYILYTCIYNNIYKYCIYIYYTCIYIYYTCIQ